MTICETPDFQFPLLADVYYPIVEQGGYGQIEKQWVLDRTIACNFEPSKTVNKENVKPNVAVTMELLLLGRAKTDLRISDIEGKRSVTNVIITNIKNNAGTELYIETSGPRSGKSTIFELATIEPFVNPFGTLEYFSLNIRRSENQAVNV
jgi:hypothetical protein